MWVPKSRQLGLPQLWSPITLREDLRWRYGLKQSCSSCRDLSNSMLHDIFTQVNRVNSQLFVVGSQIANLTFSPSFGHNLCFKCPNESCKPILNIYVLRAFQWYKKCHKTLSFDPWNCSLKFWKSTRIPSPKMGIALAVWRFAPSRFPTLPRVCDVTPRLPLGPHPCNLFVLVASPKLGLRQKVFHVILSSPSILLLLWNIIIVCCLGLFY
jgi:hypothetical protein